MKWACLLAASLCLGFGQPVRVYSEFARIDGAGNAAAPENPREILSPMAPRNGFTSFQLVVQVPARTKFSLHVGLNPEGAAQVAVYRREGTALESVTLPFDGESTQIFWMDLEISKRSPVRRVKIEPQVLLHDDWVVYPIELRVVEATVPDALPPPAWADPFSSLQAALCGFKASNPPQFTGMAQLASRNARQDAALVADLSEEGRASLRKLIGSCTAKAAADPEFYLRARDELLRLTSKTTP
jgi:hypothetical protein